jgi:hypothetical protein
MRQFKNLVFESRKIVVSSRRSIEELPGRYPPAMGRAIIE